MEMANSRKLSTILNDNDKEFLYRGIPIALTNSVANPQKVDVNDSYFKEYIASHGCGTKILFKGVCEDAFKQIISDGRLRCEKSNSGGTYGGNRIYCADDMIYSTSYGHKILVCEVADNFLSAPIGVKREHIEVPNSLNPAAEGYCGIWFDDHVGSGQDFNGNEYVVMDDDAIVIRYVFDYVENPSLAGTFRKFWVVDEEHGLYAQILQSTDNISEEDEDNGYIDAIDLEYYSSKENDADGGLWLLRKDYDELFKSKEEVLKYLTENAMLPCGEYKECSYEDFDREYQKVCSLRKAS